MSVPIVVGWPPQWYRLKVNNMVSLRLFVLVTTVQFSVGFTTSYLWITSVKPPPTSQLSYLIDSSSGEKELPELTGALEKCELHEFILKNHKPLGCSVEESLASEPDGSRFVFVSEVSFVFLSSLQIISTNAKNMITNQLLIAMPKF